MKITASIVLYNSSFKEIDKLIDKILLFNNSIIIYLIDNSPNNKLIKLKKNDNIRYYYIGNNIGFGAAHNIAISDSIKIGSKAHFIINPDIILTNDVINPMVNHLELNSDVGLIMPRILNLNGSIQYLPKLISSPFSILKRKIHLLLNINSIFLQQYELRFLDSSNITNVPIISGCFMLTNLEAVSEIGFFDESFFMYFEDWDFSRRINEKYKTIYMPTVEVLHHYESGANKNIKLFFIYIKSAIYYFNKWGWFFDKSRIKINKKTLQQFVNV